MRITRADVDKLYTLKLAADEAKRVYEAELARIKAAGENEYTGNLAVLKISTVERATVDAKAIFAKLKASAALIAKYTKTTPHLQAHFKEAA